MTEVCRITGLFLVIISFINILDLNIRLLTNGFGLIHLLYPFFIGLTWFGWEFTTIIWGCFSGVDSTGCIWIPIFGYLDFDKKDNGDEYL